MTTTAKDTVRADARQYNWAADLTDARDVFTRDEDRLIVEYTAKNGVLKSWAKSADDRSTAPASCASPVSSCAPASSSDLRSPRPPPAGVFGCPAAVINLLITIQQGGTQ